ncbi:MAG TPA: phosphopantetheine-binding protein, partial [Streptosporangiaceae bacterium]|nr:phosphopantetheine-binding protein [Streptosporangiaceae bacterium]
DHGPGDKRLAGYIVPEPAQAPDPAALRHALAATLPDYMIPATITLIDKLPLTPNGKLDRTALPAPDYAARSSGKPPGSASEERICAIFAEVLGLPWVGADDSFFALGGDSIMAISLVSRASAAGLAFSLQDVFDKQSAEALAAVAGDRPASDSPAGDSPAGDSPAGDSRPLISLNQDQLARLAGEFKLPAKPA